MYEIEVANAKYATRWICKVLRYCFHHLFPFFLILFYTLYSNPSFITEISGPSVANSIMYKFPCFFQETVKMEAAALLEVFEALGFWDLRRGLPLLASQCQFRLLHILHHQHHLHHLLTVQLFSLTFFCLIIIHRKKWKGWSCITMS